MPDIVLTTLNARYSHASFALRYLLANMGDLRARSEMLEFEIRQRPETIADAILARHPKIVGIGVYIWNVGPATKLVALLKARDPGLTIVVGGPEVSYECDQQEICRIADYVVTGEADFTFPALCAELLAGRKPSSRIVFAEPVDVNRLVLPYDLYSDEDIAHRVIYVEASRGCPFTCEFCLSSLDVPLRRFDLEPLLLQFQSLLDRGVQEFKFVDRTFNLSIAYSLKLLEFFLQRYRPGLFLHFEMIPDRLPLELREIITSFPPGSLQFEVGVQTFNKDVAERIRRKQNYEKTVDNIRFLLTETKSYIHADLIFGLPGESLESFAAGFDQLVAIGPQGIQVNILKRLRGTPIVRHDAECRMVWSPEAPYEVVENRDIDAETMQKLRRFARYWDLIANSGNFVETSPLLWRTVSRFETGAAALAAELSPATEVAAPFWRDESPFHRFMAFSDWLHATAGRTHALALDYLAERLFTYLTEMCGADRQSTAEAIWRDYRRGAKRNRPPFLAPYIDRESSRGGAVGSRLKRQARRLAASS